jgi:hypothetical protein
MYDHLDVLKRPKHVSILDDNPLFGFSTIKFNPVTRALGFSTRKYPVSTTQTRSWLWKAWKQDSTFDGVIVRWLDERLLRRDPVLKPYWRKRDLGNLQAAEEYLDKNRDAVMASVDLDSSISSMTPLAIKINDLYSFGQGGDAVSRTRSEVMAQEDETQLHVLAVDTGTWPNEVTCASLFDKLPKLTLKLGRRCLRLPQRRNQQPHHNKMAHGLRIRHRLRSSKAPNRTQRPLP